MTRTIIFSIVGVLGLLGTVWGVYCANPKEKNHKELRQRIDAQTELHRAETELERLEIEIEIRDDTKEKIRELNEEVHNGCDPDNLADALNDILGCP